MACLDLHFDCPELHVTDLSVEPDVVSVHLASTSPTSDCPCCGASSSTIQSRYTRRFADLPTQGRRLRIKLTARRFTCASPDCPRRVFCERLPGLANAYARTTIPLAESHREIGFALGGEAGARLAQKLAVPTSSDTLLRRVKSAPHRPHPTPRYIGVDDWAFKKGQRYGTIVIDLERRQVIDLLPGRDGEALKAWLKEHPGVELITRDRWAAYAQAANEAAPQAKQIADRWHLLKNLREAVERLLSGYSSEIRDAAREQSTTTEIPCVPEELSKATNNDVDSLREQTRQAKREARQEQHRRARELREQGRTIREIAERIGLSIKAVNRYLRDPKCPDWYPGRQPPTQLDQFASFIDEWIANGGRNSAEVYRLLRRQGSEASYDAVRRFLNRKIGSTGKPGRRTGSARLPTPPPAPSARKLSFAFIANPEHQIADREAAGSTILDRLRVRVPNLKKGLDLASELAQMLRKQLAQPLTEWLIKAQASGIAEVVNFADSLRRDEAAVSAAMTEPWSNGQAEGQVNRLKLIKRAMYGRGGLSLLRARVCRKN